MQASVLFLAYLMPLLAAAVDTAVNPQLHASIKMAPTRLDALKLLEKDDDWKFDFQAQKSFSYSPGSVVNANAATFPASALEELTLAWISLGPCAMLPPHHHPRAVNFVVSTEGTTTTYMRLENGAKTITTVLAPGQMTIFPRGSLHTMVNDNCHNATLISALSDPDAGTSNAVNGIFGFPEGIVEAALGSSVAGLAKNVPGVGAGANAGPWECRKRCGSA